ncbi:hypothetical protein BDY19DRAFT_906609 [Irpex rosettiformis]|uniref:Uncharacterized protein n=1 Tax=Irpex rosettiformis TaxID=378272 RepID=A0ACB8U328_9APHY|nr:hypothetical protein BDY19DRAFT_906609 [Irpex rosettiformis]
MNRTGWVGQPPQRPPSLGPNPALGGAFQRGPYPTFGMPPRNVMPGFQTLPNHRAQQNIVPQPSPNFIQQRGQSAFPFGGGIQQQSQASSQHTQQTALSHATHQQQPLPPSATTPSLPPHLSQNAAPSLTTAPSVSSASEAGLDHSEFPALGSTPTSLNTPSTTNATSYASQAGTGTGAGAIGNGVQSGAVQRDFTADDFPALGGSGPGQTSQNVQSTADGHPPGLNGFRQNNDAAHQQSLLGALSGGAQQQPGLLNLSGQARNQATFQSEADKRNYTMKLNNQNTLAAAAAAWNSPNANPSAQQQQPAFPPPTNGTHPSHTPSSQQPTTAPTQQQTQQPLSVPPGVAPSSQFSQQQQPQTSVPQHTPYAGNGNGTVAGETALHPSQSSTQPSATSIPQTPAQQVLMSPADRWGLLGLLAMIKSADLDTTLLSVGTDLGTMGLDMQTPASLYSTFITPWADSSAAHTVEPDFHLPACYQVTPPPPGPNKVIAFSEETLFFMFYSSPRDALQEIAAQELFSRNWRFHKEMRIWITKESGTPASQKVVGGEQGTYTYWDAENWEKGRKEMTVLYSDLEEKSQPVFPPSVSLQPAQAQQPSQQQPIVPASRQFQGMGVAAM